MYLSAAIDLLTTIKLPKFVVTEHKTLAEVGEKCESCYLTTNGKSLFCWGGLVRCPSFLGDESVVFLFIVLFFVSPLFAIFFALDPCFVIYF